MYIYIYKHRYICLLIYTYIYSYIHISTYTYIYLYMYIYMILYILQGQLVAFSIGLRHHGQNKWQHRPGTSLIYGVRREFDVFELMVILP